MMIAMPDRKPTQLIPTNNGGQSNDSQLTDEFTNIIPDHREHGDRLM
jgi:hypothetical protein